MLWLFFYVRNSPKPLTEIDYFCNIQWSFFVCLIIINFISQQPFTCISTKNGRNMRKRYLLKEIYENTKVTRQEELTYCKIKIEKRLPGESTKLVIGLI